MNLQNIETADGTNLNRPREKMKTTNKLNRKPKQPTKSPASSNHSSVKRPEGKLLEEIVQNVLTHSVGEWKTISLLTHEAGMDYASARKLQWSQVSETHIQWRSSFDTTGSFQVEQSPLLRRRLKSLTRTGLFVCPSIALMPGNYARLAWQKECWVHLPQFARCLKRYSIWREMVACHDRLAKTGKLPSKMFIAGERDLKGYVKARLQAILTGEPPTFGFPGAPVFNQYRAMTLAEICGLIGNLKGEWQLATLILFYLVLSVTELCAITWEQFDLATGRVKLPVRNQPNRELTSQKVQHKTAGSKKHFRDVSIHPVLLKYLRQWPDAKTGKLVSYKAADRMASDAGPIFVIAGVTDPRVKLGSICKTSILMLKRLGVSVSSKGHVTCAADKAAGMREQHAEDHNSPNLLEKLPDVLKYEPPK
jgi:hypothetical protein